MSKRPAFWLAWFTWGLYLAIAIVTLVFQSKNAPSEFAGDLLNALILLAFATVGAFIASRQPQNPIGWIFCIGTLFWGLGVLLLEYAVYSLITEPGSLPAGPLLGVFGGWARGFGWFLFITFLLLLFPNGRLPSPRWRFLAWLITGLLAAYAIASFLAPAIGNSDLRLAAVRNPLGISGAEDLFATLQFLLSLGLFAASVACIVAVVLRFRRARGVERQQLKWFAYGAALSALMLVAIISNIIAGWINSGPITTTSFYLAVVCIPISAGIAILKYRLYDIDVIINRTVVYGTLTLSLTLVYFGLVIGLQALSGWITGHTFQSPVIVVVSTLAIAALFQPLRQRIQAIIDHRFYRRKYDAEKLLATFSATLRNEVDLSELSTHLLAVVQETMQPVHVSLWLRQPEQRTRKPAQHQESSGQVPPNPRRA